jgi:hypothetical protein
MMQIPSANAGPFEARLLRSTLAVVGGCLFIAEVAYRGSRVTLAYGDTPGDAVAEAQASADRLNARHRHSRSEVSRRRKAA